ncbi:MAG: FAD-dependent oxidoreductase, partial [Planctomycetaceae bacterium]
MPLRVTNIRLPVEQPEESLPGVIARQLGVLPSDLGTWRILRKSLDARSRDDLEFVYSTQIELPSGIPNPAQVATGIQVESFDPPAFLDPEPGKQPLPE